jgi:uncharacterized repeat protein (TIGR01451 family)
MQKLITLFALTLVLFALKPQNAFADCSQMYGGGVSCPTYSFSIQKLVQKPGKGGGSYVNNMSINDPRYSPGQKVNFQIVVKNTGSQAISNINVVDSFPQFVSFVSGPGNFDNSTKALTFNIVNLNAGQTAKYTLTGKIADSNIMPSDQGVLCLINQATATDNNGNADSVSSQFCVEKQVLGTKVPQVLPAPQVTKTPATGPEMLPLIGLLPGGLAGFILRRKSSKTLKTGGEK